MVELHCARAEIDRERNLTDEIATSKHPRGSPTLSDSQRQEKSEKIHLTCTQKQDTFSTIKRYLYRLTNKSGMFGAESCWGCFAVACFSGLSDVHECSCGLQMATPPLDKQTAGCNSLNDWLMSLAMDFAALCYMWRYKRH